VLKDPKETWELLERAGADPTVTDSQARIAAYYIDHPNEIELPDTRDMSGSFRRFTSGKDGWYLSHYLFAVTLRRPGRRNQGVVRFGVLTAVENTAPLFWHGADHIENMCHVSDYELIGTLVAPGVGRTT
jgi:hypothetical protein